MQVATTPASGTVKSTNHVYMQSYLWSRAVRSSNIAEPQINSIYCHRIRHHAVLRGRPTYFGVRAGRWLARVLVGTQKMQRCQIGSMPSVAEQGIDKASPTDLKLNDHRHLHGWYIQVQLHSQQGLLLTSIFRVRLLGRITSPFAHTLALLHSCTSYQGGQLDARKYIRRLAWSRCDENAMCTYAIKARC